MIEENNRKNENPVKFSNRSEKTMIKLRTAHIGLNKLEYQYIDIKKRVFFNKHEWPDLVKY